MTDLRQLETDIVMTGPQSPMERLLEIRHALKFVKEQIKLREDEFERAALEWIEVNGPMRCGDIELRAGVRKDTKCVDVAAAIDALLIATGGDMRAFCEHLASQPIKHGASKATLDPETYERLFKVEERPKLVEGKAVKQLIEVNHAFVK